MTLELCPEVAAGLETIASANGLSVEDYLRELVERELPFRRAESAPSSGGVFVEDGLPVYRSSTPLPARMIDNAIEHSRDERARHILGNGS